MSDKEPYVTVTSGMRGYYPVLMKWDDEHEFYEPFLTGESHNFFDLAKREAKEWADAENIKYI
jgi:hypothetical protein